MRYRLSSLFVLIFVSAIFAVYLAYIQKGTKIEYLVPRDSLLAGITQLASSIESSPRTTSLEEFGILIGKHGLSTTPDHWKDYNYYWTVPKTTKMEHTYVLTVCFAPNAVGNDGLFLESAAIRTKAQGTILTWPQVWLITHRN